MRNSPLPPKVIEYCQRCSKWEGTAIVAYCCYLSFTDRTIKAAEVITVNAIAEQFGISPAKTVWIGRKVRRGSLKIKRPQSSDARKLLFFVKYYRRRNNVSLVWCICLTVQNLDPFLASATWLSSIFRGYTYVA